MSYCRNEFHLRFSGWSFVSFNLDLFYPKLSSPCFYEEFNVKVKSIRFDIEFIEFALQNCLKPLVWIRDLRLNIQVKITWNEFERIRRTVELWWYSPFPITSSAESVWIGSRSRGISSGVYCWSPSIITRISQCASLNPVLIAAPLPAPSFWLIVLMKGKFTEIILIWASVVSLLWSSTNMTSSM